MDVNEKLGPNSIMYSAFGDRVGLLPISGGWGRTKELAVIIHSSSTDAGVKIENVFIEYSTYMEYIVGVRNKDERLTKIEFIDKSQSLLKIDTKMFDKIELTIKGFKQIDYNLLKQEWEANIKNKDFDRDAFFKKEEDKTIYIKKEFWFDISEFYGSF